ncbi:MAG TPA: SET domain-containing protein-lysine N-methyltransferase [Edaphobacter sp.]
MIRSSSIHAAGCYTTRRIRKGTHIIQYDGPVFTKREADERYKDRFITYLFSANESGDVIDGFGTAMFINHSCDPNCESEYRGDEIWVVAVRDIEPGEELTYEYHLHDSDDDDADCYCGSEKCRGTMFSEEEVKRRARKAQREAKMSRA